jgi:Tfp pilus assembly protein PilN
MIRQIGAGAALLYALLLLWMAGDYLIHRHALTTWKQKISSLQAPATEAQQDSERWKTLRPAVDPTTYPLDLLAAIAAPTEGGKVRLTAFTMEKGRLHVSGEATDVTTAYAFIDQLKKSPALHEYDWNAGQPQIAGKNSVKFDMEGVRPDAAK